MEPAEIVKDLKKLDTTTFTADRLEKLYNGIKGKGFNKKGWSINNTVLCRLQDL